MDFGNYMRELRVRSKKSTLSASLHLEISRQTLMRLEEGSPTKLTTPQLRILFDFYGADADTQREALSLWSEVKEQDKTARAQGNSKGYWQAYADQLDAHFPRYLRLESAAERITSHQLVLVPGLLQTVDYRRAIAKIDNPDLSVLNTERRIELSLHRQARLEDADFQMDFLLSEAVLRHQPGGPAVMAAQMRWLAELSERTNVSIRLIPFSTGSHRGLKIQSFTMLQFPRGTSGLVVPAVVYLEGAIGALYHERQDIVDRYREAILALEAVALSQQETRDMMVRVAKEYTE
ncbi:helix-turn-helix domain-containing protein [Nocardia sp. NBC_01503]|uniref:helix-turn-helix domain-containing protein n=1 Tax=Nocardia sp. NBC_01503 TaxID=2975997 RepID=UPI002E7BEBB8|nr:helix-turn-helix transcriptional regulator [Nocardia sp. NBC_01503]WTL33973.1 helix-turn-helix domain-containing protein [Nocardia sp. NBC_01503]